MERPSFGALLEALTEASVDFIIVGGLAAIARGSPPLTRDVEIVYSRSKENLARIVSALGPLGPYPRNAPKGLPFLFDAATLRVGLNFTFETSLSWIDLLGEISGGGRYEDLLPHSTVEELYGFQCRVLDIEMLIRTKRAAGRPRDFEAIGELELLREREPKDG